VEFQLGCEAVTVVEGVAVDVLSQFDDFAVPIREADADFGTDVGPAKEEVGTNATLTGEESVVFVDDDGNKGASGANGFSKFGHFRVGDWVLALTVTNSDAREGNEGGG